MTNELSRTAFLTPEVIKATISLELTKIETGVQALNDAESKLVYNEDNLQLIADFIKQVKKAEDACEDKRKALKEAPLEEGRVIDAGAKLVSLELAAVKKKAHDKYTKMCQEIAERQKAAGIEKARKDNISNTMANVVMNFSQQIAAATTDSELIAIEKRMGVEKSKSVFYAEFLPNLILSIDNLRPLASIQKEKIRQLKQLETSIEKTESDDDKMLLLSKKEELEGHIQDNREAVQMTAIRQTGGIQIETAQEVFPQVKARRTQLKYELIDPAKTIKARPDLLNVEVNPVRIRQEIQKLKDSGDITDETEEYNLHGIRIFKSTTY